MTNPLRSPHPLQLSLPASPLPAASLLEQVLCAWNETGVAYCVLRDGSRLAELADGGEVDVLVAPHDLARVARIARHLGFARLRCAGYWPHRFFVGYDPQRDAWIKLDIVTATYYGAQCEAAHEAIGARCLAHRCWNGVAYVPAAADEFLALVLHAVLDKRTIPPPRRDRLQQLCGAWAAHLANPAALADCPLQPATALELVRLVQQGRWAELQQLGAQLAGELSRRRLPSSRSRPLQIRLRRKLSRWAAALRPDALSVAILAPDGAGKSTLAHAIRTEFFFPVTTAYMGLYPRATRVAGPRRLAGWTFAQRVLGQWRRYAVARWQQARGRFVIFDRYCYDACIPAASGAGSALRRLRRWLLAHVCPAPDLVIVLDVPADTMYARKHEHDACFLERQRQHYLRLAQALPQAIVVDGSGTADAVRRCVTAAIWRLFAARMERVAR